MSGKEKNNITAHVTCVHAKTLASMSIAMRSNIRPNVSLSYDVWPLSNDLAESHLKVQLYSSTRCG